MSFFLSIQPYTREKIQNQVNNQNNYQCTHTNSEKDNQHLMNITFAKRYRQVGQVDFQSQFQSRINSDNQISFQKIQNQSKNNLSYSHSQFSHQKQNQKFLSNISNFLEQIESQGNDGSSFDIASQSVKKSKTISMNKEQHLSQQIGLNILNSIKTGIALINSKNKLIYSNSYFKQFFGQSSQNNAYSRFLSLFIKENQQLKASIKKLKKTNKNEDNDILDSSFSEIQINNSVYKKNKTIPNKLKESKENFREIGCSLKMKSSKHNNRKSDTMVAYNQFEEQQCSMSDENLKMMSTIHTKSKKKQNQSKSRKKQFYLQQKSQKLKKSNSSININSKGKIKYKKDKKQAFQDLTLKQQIIPLNVLNIFQNDEVIVLDLIKKILSAKFKNKKNVFYSAVNLDDTQEEQQNDPNMNQKCEIKSNKQSFKGLSNKGKIDQEGNQINYYIERNNLIINFSQKGDFFQYLQLKLGVYQNVTDMQSFNSYEEDELRDQIFILVEISDQSQIQINVQEREISEYKNRMLSSVTHELRTPLNCSIQMLELLQLKLNEDQFYKVQQKEEQINPIIEAKEQFLKPALLSNYLLLNIINDILDYGQINSGYFQLSFKPFAILELMTECAEMISFQASLKGLIVELNLDPNLPQIINSDQNRIKQVLLNLLSNSLKFTEEGHIEINVQRESNELIRIDVCDTGVGIPKNNLYKIFDCFGDKSKQSILNTRGAGLGLSIANSLAMGLGGNRRIQVVSKENQGTIFSFFIINRQQNKKGCQFNLKDVFNKKLIRWETMNNNPENYFAKSSSSSIVQKALKRIQTNDSITNYSNNSRYNADPNLCGLGSEQNENTLYNDQMSVKTFSVANNLITFTIKPSSKQQQEVGSVPTRNKSVSMNLTISTQQRKQLGPNRISSNYDQNVSLNSFGDEKQQNEFTKNSKIDYKNFNFKINANQGIQQNGIERFDSSQILEDAAQEAFYIPNESYIKGTIKGQHILNFLNQRSELYQQTQGSNHDIYPQIQIDQYPNYEDLKVNIKKKLSTSSVGSSKIGSIDNRLNSNLTPIDSYTNFQPDQRKETILKQLTDYNKKQLCNCTQILVVDDNDFNLYVLFLRLKTYGFKIEKAGSGEIAIQKVRQKLNSQECCRKYKLIFMDIDMPVKDGHQTTAEINNFFLNQNMQPPPISAYTAYVQQKEINKAFESGMKYYITKPINQKDLEEVLYQVFHKLF
ncbi:ATPase, histidine kinase-, DNA gyrase B (macronuclear) [Tetrahymena thermophila SB210]|uniref:ATPase, histidine kinase-, DNA gyrase B n=1 Tax=Tetrahymena thermophila (strain SB210) TaxID=312017 RepID=Q22D36_TETTS|nr:ATPase, histidine kinase-, DNA gyrase B [Tetrahymena thermophila SB210]EAR83217.2 ATPase, histidine kinase-, DNA gyrase B [Tetrahymena thermophila SB210]|eukprot:XP_001030880.2 ATPase, histidine kinase-, DNA gyrase B [Tetrahymena thermophila SB210]